MYKMVGAYSFLGITMSKGLVSVLDLANTRLRNAVPHKGRYTVRVSFDDVATVVGGSVRAREVIVEAINRRGCIHFCACGTSWPLLSKVWFDGEEMAFEYRPNAASVIKAMMMEVKE